MILASSNGYSKRCKSWGHGTEYSRFTYMTKWSSSSAVIYRPFCKHRVDWFTHSRRHERSKL